MENQNTIDKNAIVETYEKVQKRDKIHKVILITIIIMLLFMYFLGYRLGKIGYLEVPVNSQENMGLIQITRKRYDYR